MTIEKCFMIPEKDRTAIIDKSIVGKLPEKERETAKTRATKIVNDFVGRDVDAISVLIYAAERGRFDEFAVKLEKHYKESMQYVHPEARMHPQIPGAIRAERFFIDCYKSMGIKPQGQNS